MLAGLRSALEPSLIIAALAVAGTWASLVGDLLVCGGFWVEAELLGSCVMNTSNQPDNKT